MANKPDTTKSSAMRTIDTVLVVAGVIAAVMIGLWAFGTIVGLVTVEDVLEQIVGPIQDEYDEKTEAQAGPSEAGEVELDGATRIRDLETEHGIEIPAEAGFETLAGFLLYRLGYIPHAGEHVEFGGRRYTVLDMDRNRIARVRIERVDTQGAPASK